ncbi:MAG: GTP-binding protein [Lachnospiraceae bacterium]
MGEQPEAKSPKKHICMGLLAHVDAGKTTFSEQLLYLMGVTRKVGRVDNQDTVLDNDTIEKKRGITIFAGSAYFDYKEARYYLLDTPGHTDFAAEAERAASVLDYAILLINGSAKVQAHTITLFRMLERYHIPTFIFINKCDMPDVNVAEVFESVKEKLSPRILLWDDGNLETMAEAIADLDDEFAEKYLEDEWTKEDLNATVRKLIKKRELFLVGYGSALRNQGIMEFFDLFHRYTESTYEQKNMAPMQARIYKIQYDDRQNRLTWLKILKGTLHVKNTLNVQKSHSAEVVTEKINELYYCFGNHQVAASEAKAGDLVVVSGLKTPISGALLGAGADEATPYFVPTLQSAIHYPKEVSITKMLAILRQLEEEEPQLRVNYEGETEQILISVMGKIQLEVLEQILRERFSIAVTFEKPKILYQETIRTPIMGYGHFEPLRHYAEVNLRLEPLPSGSGIQFSSECHVDILGLNWQRLIETHVFEKNHRGILTGSPLTDVKVVLVNGRSHIKHTEGGDFREATYRAIRQGLEKAQNVLLEPYYEFEITADSDYLGKILSDIQRMSGEFEPAQIRNHSITIKGSGPVSEFMEYPTQLIALTKGMGNIFFQYAGYRPCHNAQEVITHIGYDKNTDANNVSCSIFCSHGTSFVVSWDEAENYMHCLH